MTGAAQSGWSRWSRIRVALAGIGLPVRGNRVTLGTLTLDLVPAPGR